MDLYCPVCAEPIDFDELHYMGDYTDGVDVPFAVARERFARIGCEAFGQSHNRDGVGSFRAEASSMLFDLLGDDVDGVAAMMEDAEYMGMFE
jgi:hypothetical protein